MTSLTILPRPPGPLVLVRPLSGERAEVMPWQCQRHFPAHTVDDLETAVMLAADVADYCKATVCNLPEAGNA